MSFNPCLCLLYFYFTVSRLTFKELLYIVELFVCLSTCDKCKLHLWLHPPDAAFHLYLTGTFLESIARHAHYGNYSTLWPFHLIWLHTISIYTNRVCSFHVVDRQRQHFLRVIHCLVRLHHTPFLRLEGGIAEQLQAMCHMREGRDISVATNGVSQIDLLGRPTLSRGGSRNLRRGDLLKECARAERAEKFRVTTPTFVKLLYFKIHMHTQWHWYFWIDLSYNF